MQDHNQVTSRFFRQLLYIQATGLMFSIAIGLLLYLEPGHRIDLMVISTSFIGLCLVLRVYRQSIFSYLGTLCAGLLSTTVFNTLAFSIVWMLLLGASHDGFYTQGSQEVFTLSLISALFGILSARIWQGCLSNAKDKME